MSRLILAADGRPGSRCPGGCHSQPRGRDHVLDSRAKGSSPSLTDRHAGALIAPGRQALGTGWTRPSPMSPAHLAGLLLPPAGDTDREGLRPVPAPTLLATVLAVTFVVELPDKSLFASLLLGTRYQPGPVWLGVAAAFAVHVVLAVTAGSLLTAAPHQVVGFTSAALFLGGAVWMLRFKPKD